MAASVCSKHHSAGNQKVGGLIPPTDVPPLLSDHLRKASVGPAVSIISLKSVRYYEKHNKDSVSQMTRMEDIKDR